MVSVTEGSSAQLAVTFYNSSGVAESPDSGTYKITDQNTGREILPATNISPIASQVMLALTPTVNTLVSQGKGHEIRVVTVVAVYGDDDQQVGEYTYRVNNSRAT